MITANEADRFTRNLGSAGVVIWDVVDSEKSFEQRLVFLKDAKRMIDMTAGSLSALIALAETDRRQG